MAVRLILDIMQKAEASQKVGGKGQWSKDFRIAIQWSHETNKFEARSEVTHLLLNV